MTDCDNVDLTLLADAEWLSKETTSGDKTEREGEGRAVEEAGVLVLLSGIWEVQTVTGIFFTVADVDALQD